MVRRQLFFYGWVIVGIAVVSMPLIYGTRNSFSIFFPSILDEFHWSRRITAIMLSLNLLIYGLVAPVAGHLGDRWKPRKVMLVGIVMLSLATGGCAFAHELWHFYILFGILMPLGTAFCGWPLLAPVLANWFARRRGLVMGLGLMGSSLSFVYGIFTEFLIFKLGWRHAYLVSAGILIAVVPPLYLLLLQTHPESKGLKAYGNTEKLQGDKDITTESPAIAVFIDLTLVQVLKMSQLWLLVFSHFLYWGIGTYLVLAHQVKFIMDLGYSSMFGAYLLALCGIFMVAGQSVAFMSDWIGRGKTGGLAAMLSIGALVALILVRDTSQPWLLYVYAICFGFGGGLYAPTLYAVAADIYYGRQFGGVVGLILTGMGLGGAIGPWLGGYIYDVTGTYRSAFVVCIICFAFAIVSLWIAAPRKAARLRAEISRDE